MKNGLHIDEEGNKRHYRNDILHRVNGPAVEWSDGTKFWWLNGERHREDGPASEWSDGTKHWYVNGKLHRENGPAQTWADGTKHWCLNGTHLFCPKEFETMEAFFQELNDNEDYSLQWINDFNGLISFIKNPTDKQSRLHAMKWKI